MMYEPSPHKDSDKTESPKSISSSAGSRARTCPALENWRASKGKGRDYGLKCFESCGKCALAGSLQKTCVTQLILHSTPVGWAWKPKATKSGLSYFLHLVSERPTKGKGCSSWPTPRANDAEKRGEIANDPRNGLPAAAKYWPTPAAQDAKNSTLPESQVGRDTVPGAVIGQLWPTPRAGKTTGEDADTWLKRKEAGKVSTPPLDLAVRLWPTPVAHDAVGSTGGSQHSSLRTNIQGQLNADWVECLMAFPIGWTDVDCAEPQPWPGWPAPLGAGHIPTPTVQDGEKRTTIAQEMKRMVNGKQASVTGAVGLTESGQYPYEPPRVTNGQRHRRERLKCCGNGVVWLQVLPIMRAIMEVEYDFLYA